jgi:hypothetical protein
LDSNRRNAWQDHLDGCPVCRTERDTLAKVLKTVKTAHIRPALNETDASVMRNRVIKALTDGASTRRDWWKSFFSVRSFAPALAAACVLVIALGLVTSKLLTGPEIEPAAHLSLLQEQLPADDIAIVTNLDLLYNLDNLNKLAKAIDQPEPEPQHDNVQGKHDEERATFV